MHFQRGELLRQLIQAVDHRLIRHGLVLGHSQLRLLPPHQRQRPAIEPLALAQQLAGILQQGSAGLGQPRLATTAALEQGDAQVSFK
ncbi:hypothetical protein D9M71_735400 [compost metagenome]